MSQIQFAVNGGGPAVPTQFTTDSGVAVPAANNLNVLANDTTANDADGITTTGSGSTVTVLLTNRLQGTGSTVGAVTADLITFSLGATAGVFTFEVNVSGFESTTPAGCGYSIFGTARTNGGGAPVATLIGTPDKIVNEDAALTTSDCNMIVSGNNVIIRATGTAALTTNWNAVGYYVLRT